MKGPFDSTGAGGQSGDSEVNSPLPDVSVVLPAMNEEETIGECIDTIRAVFAEHHINGEIIVADSSKDHTPEIARSKGAIVISPRKIGYGNAYIEGFAQARGKYLVMGDADGTYEFRQIPAMIALLEKGNDLVLASRFRGSISRDSMPWLHRYIGNPFLSGLLNVVFGTKFSDAHTGFRAMKKEAFERLELRTGGMEFASEMLIEASRKGLSIDEVPTSYYPRKTPSKLHSFADGWRHVRFILLKKPLPFLIIPGIIFSLIGGGLLALFYLQGNVEKSHLNSFLLAALLLSGGVQTVFSGVTIKTYSILSGYDEKKGLMGKLMDYHSLELFLVIGGILVLAGIVTGLYLLSVWVESGFGFLPQISLAVLTLLSIIIGLQVLFFAIFMSMMLLNENIYRNNGVHDEDSVRL